MGGTGRQAGSGVESAGDLITEYERRGRARVRDRDDTAPVGTEETEKTYYAHDTWGLARSGDGATGDPREGDSSMKPAKVDGAAYRPRKNRPLSIALSESPSRERLSDIFNAHHYKSSNLSKVDGNGPYHPEQPRPESMDVLDGSTHSIPDWGAEERHDQGGWAESVPAGGSGNMW